jgi:type IX secretion system PorP/SprF family membrane protein
MMKFKLLLCLLLLNSFLIGPKCFSQADISMATNWYNRANYNPASIAREDYIYIFSDIQKQWLGVGGSPTIFNVQASEYIYNLHSAFGISLVSDNLALTSTINPMLTYAYRIKSLSEWSVSMGLSAGIFSRSVDGSLFEPGIQADPELYNNLVTTLLPDANAGIEFQSKHYVAGLASTHILSIGKTDNAFLNSTHYYGYFIYKNTDSELLNYNAGLQVVKGPVLTVLEGNASVRFKKGTGLSTGPNEIFDIGLSYRTSNQLILLLGLNLTSNLRIGYAYDQSFTVGFNANSSHEIMLEYRIPNKASSSCNCDKEGFWYY